MENVPAAFHPLDHISVLRRQMWWLITPVVLSLMIGGALVLLLPRTYETTATLGISLPKMGGQVVSDAQRLTAQERVRSFNQVLLSPPVLERVAKAEGMDKTMPLADAVGLIGSKAKVTLPPPDPTQPQGSVELFFLTFSSPNPELAQRVTNRLADVFIDESSMKRTVRAEETSAFIAERLKASQTRLNELEGQLRVAKEGFMGALPEQTQSNVALVTAAQQQLTATSNALRSEQERLNWIDREIGSSKPTIDDPATPGRSVPSMSPGAVRIATLEKQLAEARATYTDRHPDVISLQDELKRARANLAAEVNLPEDQREARLRADPAYNALLKEREQVNLNINSLKRQLESNNQSIGKYTTRVDTAPRVEQQLAGLQRETDLERQRYTLLTQKLNDAQITELVEQNRGSEHFTIVARAWLPEKPASPNAPRLMIMAVLLGLCLGGGLALGREYLDRSIHDARALNDLDLPVLGEIPRISHV